MGDSDGKVLSDRADSLFITQVNVSTKVKAMPKKDTHSPQGAARAQTILLIPPEPQHTAHTVKPQRAVSNACSGCMAQRAKVTGQKVGKTLKLPKIDSAAGVDAVTQSALSTQLIEANTEMAQVQTMLDHKKIEYNEHMARCNQREEMLSLKQAKLWTEKDKYKRIIEVETSLKRDRARKRALEEEAVRQKKEEEVANLKEELLSRELELEARKSKLDTMVKYTQYFENLVSWRSTPGEEQEQFHHEGGEFADIEEVTDKRYPTLMHACKELQQTVNDNIDQFESASIQLKIVEGELQNAVLSQQSQVAALQDRLKHLRVENVRLEVSLV